MERHGEKRSVAEWSKFTLSQHRAWALYQTLIVRLLLGAVDCYCGQVADNARIGVVWAERLVFYYTTTFERTHYANAIIRSPMTLSRKLVV